MPAIGTIASETEPEHHTIARSDLGSTYCPKNSQRHGRRWRPDVSEATRRAFSVAIACTELADTTGTANVIIRPPIAWAVAVLAGLAINWLMPLPFVPAAVSAGWLGAIVFALALALVAWAIAIITRAGSNVPTNLPTTTLLVSCCTIAPRLAQNEERECAGREAGNRRGLGQGEMAINYRSHFACRIDAWDADGEKVIAKADE